MSSLSVKTSTACFFSDAIDDDCVIIDVLSSALRILTTDFFGFGSSYPRASVGVRLKSWKSMTEGDISPINAKHAEVLISCDSRGYGIELTAIARQNLFPVISPSRYRASPFCKGPVQKQPYCNFSTYTASRFQPE